LGRSRGGFSTKLHLAAADERTVIATALTPGQCGDAPRFPEVLAAVPEACPVEAAAADKAFDSDAIRKALADRGIEAVIPPLACRKEPIAYDAEKYRQRNKVERLINRVKQFRGIATRYDKLARTFLAFIHLAFAFIMIT
jgi:transposase